ncbi:MAG: aminodeoxychorismate/anthranilate synthase component II [Thermodesulfobacteriota bacterium]
MILLLDNYDSFTYNVAHALGALNRQVHVVRSDAVSLDQIEDLNPEAIVISPGPGRPDQAWISCSAIEHFAGRVPILGVCLGHQCLAEVLGAKVVRNHRPVHGKTSSIFHDGRTIYRGLDNPFPAARYHSLVVPEDTVPPSLEVTARTGEGEVMGLRAKEMPVEGVQFHPESVATPLGMDIFRNFLEHYLAPS